MVSKRFEGDARAIVPVSDEIGGTVIYMNGRLAYYVLDGEWIEALPPFRGLVSTGGGADPARSTS